MRTILLTAAFILMSLNVAKADPAAAPAPPSASGPDAPPTMIPPPPPGTPPPPPTGAMTAPANPPANQPAQPPQNVQTGQPQYPPGPPPGYVPPPPMYGYPPPAYPYYYGQPRYGEIVPGTFQIANFRIAEFGAFQPGTHQYALFLSWNPQFTFKSGSYVGANIGGTVVTDALGENVLALDTQFIAGTQFGSSPLGIEGGIGLQTWGGTYGNSYPLLTATLFSKLHAGFLDRVFVSYGAFLMDAFYTTEVKIGVGVSF